MLEEEEDTEDLYIHFAEFEEFCKEFERARAIFKYALDHVPKGKAEALYARFVTFEKQHGDRETIEEVLSAKKRLQVGHQRQACLHCALTCQSKRCTQDADKSIVR